MVWTQEFFSEVWASLPARRPMIRGQHQSGTKERRRMTDWEESKALNDRLQM